MGTLAATPVEIVEQYLEAYNNYDIEAPLAQDVYLTHHNRGFVTESREATVALCQATPDLIPDRALVDRTGLMVDGNKVLVQHTLEGTNKVDTPFGPACETISISLATVFTIADGKVSKYEDYG